MIQHSHKKYFKVIKKEAPLDETFKRATSVSFDFFEWQIT